MPSKNIKNKKELQSKKDIKNNQYSTYTKLYGMTLEQYIQGQTIHSQYFDQLKKIQVNN